MLREPQKLFVRISEKGLRTRTGQVRLNQVGQSFVLLFGYRKDPEIKNGMLPGTIANPYRLNQAMLDILVGLAIFLDSFLDLTDVHATKVVCGVIARKPYQKVGALHSQIAPCSTKNQ